MLSLMQQNGGALGIIDRISKKIGINRHDLEWKIGRGIRVFFSYRGVQPVVVTAIYGEVVEQHNFIGKPSLPEYCDRRSYFAFLILVQRFGRGDKRNVKPYY